MIWTLLTVAMFFGAIVGCVLTICAAQVLEERAYQRKKEIMTASVRYARDHKVSFDEAKKILTHHFEQ